MFGLRFTTEVQARSKKGRPAQTTTGIAQASCSQFETAREIGSPPAPRAISVIASANTGNPIAAAIQKRRVMSISSTFGPSSGVTVRGWSAMPQWGQGAGSVSRTFGHIGQTYTVPADGDALSAAGGAVCVHTGACCGDAGASHDAAWWPCIVAAGAESPAAFRKASGACWNAVWQPPQQK